MQFTAEYAPAGPPASDYTVVGPLALYQYADAIRAVVTNTQAGGGTSGSAVALTQQNLGSGGFPTDLDATTIWAIELGATFTATTSANFPEIGVVVMNGTTAGVSTGWAISFITTTTNMILNVSELTADGDRVSNPYSTATAGNFFGTTTGRLHLRLVNDGAVLHYQQSADGDNWNDAFAQVSPTGMTWYGFNMATEVGGNSQYGQAFVSSNSVSIPNTYVATNVTGDAVPVQISFATPSLPTLTPVVGDVVAVQNVTGNTNANSANSGSFVGGSGWMVSAVSSAAGTTTISITDGHTAIIGNNPWTGGGNVTLLSR
jgi:hypothetical protein